MLSLACVASKPTQMIRAALPSVAMKYQNKDTTFLYIYPDSPACSILYVIFFTKTLTSSPVETSSKPHSFSTLLPAVLPVTWDRHLSPQRYPIPPMHFFLSH